MSRQSAFSAITVLSISLCVGCDTDSFMPPPPPELAGATVPPSAQRSSGVPTRPLPVPSASANTPSAPTSASSIKGIELILSRPSTVEREKLVFILRAEAGRLKVVFRLVTPDTTSPMTPSRMATAIKKASERHCLIVLESIDSPEVCDALREAQSQDSVILMLDSSPGCRNLSRQLPSIGFSGFPERAKQLVETVLFQAANRSFAPDRPIVILENGPSYSCSAARLTSLEGALEEKKLGFERIHFDGDHNQARIALEKYLETHPTPRIVLAHDHEGLAAAIGILEKPKPEHKDKFLVAGYAIYDIRSGFALTEDLPAILSQSVEAYTGAVARAVRDAVAGKPLRDRIDINVELLHVRPESHSADPKPVDPRSAVTPPGRPRRTP